MHHTYLSMEQNTRYKIETPMQEHNLTNRIQIYPSIKVSTHRPNQQQKSLKKHFVFGNWWT